MQALVSLATNASFGFSYTNFAKLRVLHIDSTDGTVMSDSTDGTERRQYVLIKRSKQRTYL